MHAIALDGPAVEPVGLAEMKAHLRLDGTDEDELVTSLVTAARRAVEGWTRLALVEQSWRLGLDRWPAGRILALPLAPVLAIGSVRLLDRDGTAATLDPGLYRLEAARDPALLVLHPAVEQPGRIPGGIAIELSCGFGATAASVPPTLRLAIRRLVACWFENRGDGPPAGALPPEVLALLAPHARPRLA